jgi:hypothetical protein
VTLTTTGPEGASTRWVEVTSPFYVKREVQEIGKRLEFDWRFAAEIVAVSKARYVDGPLASEADTQQQDAGEYAADPSAKGRKRNGKS